MITTFAMVSLLVTHWIGDFILQSNWAALNKSKSWVALLYHTIIYSLCFIPLFGMEFAIITWVLHTATDYVTSRVNAKLWFIDLPELDPYGHGLGEVRVDPKLRHWFFTSIGFDQLLHGLGLIWTLRLLS